MKNNHSLVWFQSGIGHDLFMRERDALDVFLADNICDRVLQLGAPSFWDNFPKFHYIHYDDDYNFPVPGHNICGDYKNIGILTECVDVVVVPHLQELREDFKSVIPEIMRVLKPGGSVVVFGFNPLSLWGMQRILGLGKVVPWCNKFFNAGTVIKSFEDNDFYFAGRENVYRGFYSDYSLIYKTNTHMSRFNLSTMGAVYKLVFQKRISTMTLNTEKSKYYTLPSGV